MLIPTRKIRSGNAQTKGTLPNTLAPTKGITAGERPCRRCDPKAKAGRREGKRPTCGKGNRDRATGEWEVYERCLGHNRKSNKHFYCLDFMDDCVSCRVLVAAVVDKIEVPEVGPTVVSPQLPKIKSYL